MPSCNDLFRMCLRGTARAPANRARNTFGRPSGPHPLWTSKDQRTVEIVPRLNVGNGITSDRPCEERTLYELGVMLETETLEEVREDEAGLLENDDLNNSQITCGSEDESVPIFIEAGKELFCLIVLENDQNFLEFVVHKD